MNQPLLLEALVAEHQRELVEEAGRQPVTAGAVRRSGLRSGLIAIVLRWLAVASITRRGSETEFRPQMATIDHA